MSKILILGIVCGLAFGIGLIYKNKHDKNNVTKTDDVVTPKEENLHNDPLEQQSEDVLKEFDAGKEHAEASIVNRHKEVAQVIKESFVRMNDDTVVSSEYEKEFDDMLNELDMLSE